VFLRCQALLYTPYIFNFQRPSEIGTGQGFPSDLPKVTMPVGGKAGTPTLNTLNVVPSHCAHFCVICCPLDHLISKPTTETATIVLNLLECHSKKGREASDKDMVI